MEEITQKQVWQRVRESGAEETLRRWLAEQGQLWTVYRNLSRRGGRFRQLFEQKDRQLSCLRGLLRLRTGQCIARPRCTGTALELCACYEPENRFLEELSGQSSPVLTALAQGQKQHLCLLLELLGSA